MSEKKRDNVEGIIIRTDLLAIDGIESGKEEGEGREGAD